MLRRSRPSQSLVLLLSIALLAGAGCNGTSATKGRETPAVTEVPAKEDRVIEMSYTAEVEGDLDLSYAGKIGVRVLTLTGTSPNFTGPSLLSVGANEPVPLGQERWFRVAFDLMRYQGDGRYQIRAGSVRDLLEQVEPSPGSNAPPQGPDHSNVLVQYWTVKPAFGVEPETFNTAVEPCPVEVSKGGLTGTLACSGVKDEKGRVISVRMIWG